MHSADDEDLEGKLRFLREAGAAAQAHSHGTLLEHLTGVRALLRGWGASDALCDAGLFHSVYGTEYFGAASVEREDRERVRAAIGADAEELAWLWCTIRRHTLAANLERDADFTVSDRTSGDELPLTQERLVDLANLWAADTVEQYQRLGGRTRCLEELYRLRTLALPGAREALEAALGAPEGRKSTPRTADRS
ncbi:MAG: DUF6817 domain-containing protein [Planctomycetota bacterium]